MCRVQDFLIENPEKKDVEKKSRQIDHANFSKIQPSDIFILLCSI